MSIVSSRSCWSATRTASSGAATSSGGVSDGCGDAGADAGATWRLRGIVDNAPVLGALLGQVVAVARAIDIDADRGHGEAIEDSRGQGRVAQVLAPFAKLDIRSERGGGVFVPAVEQVEEDVGRGGLVVAAAQLPEPDVINDEPLSARPAAHPGFVGLIREPRIKVVNQIDAARIADLDLPLAGAERERLQDMALASTALAGDQEILALVDEAERGQALDDGTIEILLEGPVEGFEGLSHAQAAGVDAPLDATLPQVLGTVAKHPLEQHEGGRVVLMRPGEVGIEMLVEVFQSESLEVVSESLEDAAVSSGLGFGSAASARWLGHVGSPEFADRDQLGSAS